MSQSLPQEWEEHLKVDAKIWPVEKIPARDAHLLDFSTMHPDTFEQFIWWLLQKRHTLVGCKRLGRSGSPQWGIDLFAYDLLQPDKLIVFECKRHADFEPKKLSNAVTAFLGGEWKHLVRTFVLILSQKETGGPLLKCWTEEQARLKSHGIESELWDGHELTLKVQAYPDVLSKFFPMSCVQSFANEWMEKVAFHEALSRALQDTRPHISQWARSIAAPLSGGTAAQHQFVIDGTLRSATRFGSSWQFKGPRFSLSAILPDQRSAYASAALSMTRSDISGVTIVLNHQWLMQNVLFASTSAPLSNRYRGFIVNASEPSSNENYVIDLPGCRLSMDEEGVRELVGVADVLTKEVEGALLTIEEAWGARYFPFVKYAGTKVAIAAIDHRVWQEILRFANEHDISRGKGSWFMFDAAANVLKPYTEHGSDEFATGYHGIFYARDEIEGLSYSGEVVILWQPDDLRPNEKLSSRTWWSCETALQWFRDKLLPEVKHWVHQREFGSWAKQIFQRKRAAGFSQRLDEIFQLRDLRRFPLLHNGLWRLDMVVTLEALQRHFNDPMTPQPYIAPEDMKRLYRSAGFLAKGEKGYVGYAASNLCLRDEVENHHDLIAAIEKHVEGNQVVASSTVADYVLRAMLELLDDDPSWIDPTDRSQIWKSLETFACIHDEAAFVERHRKWV